jgi:quercetin dioxygenase-like cupin family protein
MFASLTEGILVSVADESRWWGQASRHSGNRPELASYFLIEERELEAGGNLIRTLGRRKYREESTMSNEQAAPETQGVAVDSLATVDLGPEIEGMTGRQLRMRMVTIEPGGVFGPIHDHKDRPGIVYILQGTITDHRNGVATDYGPGVGWPEDRNTTHWLENRGTIPAVEISVDIVRQE